MKISDLQNELDKLKNQSLIHADLVTCLEKPSLTLSEIIVLIFGRYPGEWLEHPESIGDFPHEFKVYREIERAIIADKFNDFEGKPCWLKKQNLTHGTRYWVAPVKALVWIVRWCIDRKIIVNALAITLFEEFKPKKRKRGRKSYDDRGFIEMLITDQQCGWRTLFPHLSAKEYLDTIEKECPTMRKIADAFLNYRSQNPTKKLVIEKRSDKQLKKRREYLLDLLKDHPDAPNINKPSEKLSPKK